MLFSAKLLAAPALLLTTVYASVLPSADSAQSRLAKRSPQRWSHGDSQDWPQIPAGPVECDKGDSNCIFLRKATLTAANNLITCTDSNGEGLGTCQFESDGGAGKVECGNLDLTVYFGTDYSYFVSDGTFAYWSSERSANGGQVPDYPSNTSFSGGDDLYIECSY